MCLKRSTQKKKEEIKTIKAGGGGGGGRDTAPLLPPPAPLPRQKIKKRSKEKEILLNAKLSRKSSDAKNFLLAWVARLSLMAFPGESPFNFPRRKKESQ